MESLAILDNGVALEFYDDMSEHMKVRVKAPTGTFVAELVTVSAGTPDSTGVFTLRWTDWTGHQITRNISIDRLLAETDGAVQGVDHD